MALVNQFGDADVERLLQEMAAGDKHMIFNTPTPDHRRQSAHGPPETQTSRLAGGTVGRGTRPFGASAKTAYLLGCWWRLCHPARGRKGVGRLVITRIRQQDVRTFTEEDAHREGFADLAGFLNVWCLMHDYAHRHASLAELWQRPLDNYLAIVLEFEAR